MYERTRINEWTLKHTSESARKMYVAVHAKISRIDDLVGTWIYIPISAFKKLFLGDGITL